MDSDSVIQEIRDTLNSGKLSRDIESLLRESLGLFEQNKQQIERLQTDFRHSKNSLQRQVDRLKAEIRALSFEKKELEQSEHRYRLLVEHAAIPILVHRAGIVLFANQAVADLLGFTLPSDVVGKNMMEWIHPEDRGRVLERVRRVMLFNEVAPPVETRIIRKNKSIISVEAVGIPTVFNGQPAVQVAVVDLSRYKNTEYKLRQEKERAEELNRLKTSFLAGVSHEVRTPLSGILGYASILADQLENPEHKNLVRRIELGGNRLLETINSIIDLAKIESKKFDFSFEILDLNSELEDAVKILSPLALRKGLGIHLQLPDEPVHAFADLNATRTVINNLISNAIKYSTSGTIRISAKRNEEFAQIEVEDQGIGISDSFLPELFAEFTREHGERSDLAEGSGLGLSITKKLLDAMNGHIFVESKKDEGSLFVVELPLPEFVHLEPATQEEERVYLPASKNQSNPVSQWDVLVVEDDLDTQHLIGLFLKESVLLDLSRTGQHALNRIKKKAYHAILLDINLPDDLNGPQLLTHIRSCPLNKDCPVIAFTAFAMKGDEEKYLDLGFSDYLAKPFSKKELIDTIVRNCRREHYELMTPSE